MKFFCQNIIHDPIDFSYCNKYNNFQGMYMQVGDIVSMTDIDGGTYYAQIRGFMTDQYCEKSAVVTWLLPTRASPPPEQRFDPATYIIGT
jgi:GATA zinc finger domain-containing protein 1